MDSQEIAKLAIQRYKAHLLNKQAAKEYIENMTQDNHDKMRANDRNYQSFRSIIYTHSNIIEMIKILKESTHKEIVLDELDGYVVTFKLSINNLPVLSVKASKDETPRE